MMLECYVKPLKGPYEGETFEIRWEPGLRVPYRKKGSQRDFMIERSQFYKTAYEQGKLSIGKITMMGKEEIFPDEGIKFSRIAKQVILRNCDGMARARNLESLAQSKK